MCLHRAREIVGSNPDRVKPKTIQFVYVASPLSTKHSGERADCGWLEIRIMCLSGATCLSTVSEGYHYKKKNELSVLV